MLLTDESRGRGAADGWQLLVRRPLMDGSVLSHDRWFAVSACAASGAWMVASARTSRGATRTLQASPRGGVEPSPSAPGARVRGSRELAAATARRAAGGARVLVASAAGKARRTPSGSRGPGNVGSRTGCVTPPSPLRRGREGEALPKFGSQKRAIKAPAGSRNQPTAAPPSPLPKSGSQSERGRRSQKKTAPPQNKHGDAHPQG